jgi:hypothetical protein
MLLCLVSIALSSCFRLSHISRDTVLIDFTFYADCSAESDGGAISIRSTRASATIARCAFSRCLVTGHFIGGAVAFSCARLTIDRCSCSDCRAYCASAVCATAHGWTGN